MKMPFAKRKQNLNVAGEIKLLNNFKYSSFLLQYKHTLDSIIFVFGYQCHDDVDLSYVVLCV